MRPLPLRGQCIVPLIIVSILGNRCTSLTAPKLSKSFSFPQDTTLFYNTASLDCVTSKFNRLVCSTAILVAVCGISISAGAAEPSSLTQITTSSISDSVFESASAINLLFDGKAQTKTLNQFNDHTKLPLASLTELKLPDVIASVTSASSSRQNVVGDLQQVTDNQAISNSRKYKLCHAPATKKLFNLFLIETATVYISERDDEIGSDQYSMNANDVDYDNRENIRQISSHLFVSNPIVGSHWINIKGSYEKISEILCRVTWQKIWLDSSSQKNGPTNLADTEKHILPQLVQLAGENLIFRNSATFPDLYSVYSPCLFR